MASRATKEFQLQFAPIRPQAFLRRLRRRIEADDGDAWFIDGQGYIRLLTPEYIDQGGLSCTAITDGVIVRAHNSQFAVADCRHVLLSKFVEMVFDLRDRTLAPYIKHLAGGPFNVPDATVELVACRDAVWRNGGVEP